MCYTNSVINRYAPWRVDNSAQVRLVFGQQFAEAGDLGTADRRRGGTWRGLSWLCMSRCWHDYDFRKQGAGEPLS
jgi:hypothetical protein